MPFLLVRFFILFPNQNRKLGWWDAFTVLAMTGSGLTPIWHNLEAWWPATMTALRTLFGGGLLLGIVLQVRRWWFSARDVRERRQIEWAGLGLFVGLTPLFCLVIVPGWLGISFEPFSWLAILPIAAVPLGFFAALTEYRLWDATLDPAAIQGQVNLSLGMTDAAFRDHSWGDATPIGSHYTSNRTQLGGRRGARLTGDAWSNDTHQVRELTDRLFWRTANREQVAALYAATRWERPNP